MIEDELEGGGGLHLRLHERLPSTQKACPNPAGYVFRETTKRAPRSMFRYLLVFIGGFHLANIAKTPCNHAGKDDHSLTVFSDSEVLDVSVSTIISSNPLPPDFDDSEAWCKHISSTPEPPLVIYNRIPKAGGTTMQTLYEDKLSVRLLQDYWGSTDQNNLEGKLQQKFSSILEKSEEGTTTIVDGHFKPMFRVHNATFINLMRLPKPRTISYFYYSLYDSFGAKSRNGTNVELLEKLKAPYLDETCLTSDSCLKYLKESCRGQIGFLSEGGYDKIDIGKILSNEILEVLGFQEELEKSLDIFECVFPSIFKGAKQKLKTMGASNVGKHKFGIISKDLEKLMDETFCIEEMELYKRALQQFNYRYNKMVLNRSSCCRV